MLFGMQELGMKNSFFRFYYISYLFLCQHETKFVQEKLLN